MERRDTAHGSILGTIPGFVPDGEAVTAALDALRPNVVALGVPPEDLAGLQALAEADDPGSLMPDPVDVPDLPGGAGAPGLEAILGGGGADEEKDRDDVFSGLDPLQHHLLRLLQRFGDVALPSPDLDAAYRWALDNDARIEALDMDDDAHTDVYVAANKFWDVIKNNRMQKRLMAMEFKDANDAHELVRRFDAEQMRLKALRTVEEAKEAHMAKRLAGLQGQAVAVVPLARLDGVAAALP